MHEQYEVFRQGFLEECTDLLISGEAHLIALGDHPDDPEELGAVFRAVHSIKGGAGAFGYDRMVAFTHDFESILDNLRGGKIKLDRAGHTAILRAFDILADLVRAARENTDLPTGHETLAAEQLKNWFTGITEAASYEMVFDTGLSVKPAKKAKKKTIELAADDGLHKSCYRIRFVPDQSIFKLGHEPLLILRELGRMGDLTLNVDHSRLPGLAGLDPQMSYLGWNGVIVTEASREALEEIFEFINYHSLIEIEDITRTGSSTVLPGGENVVDFVPACLIENAPIITSISANDDDSDARKPVVTGAVTNHAVMQSSSIRVDIDRLDRLVNMVGEIVITQAMLAQRVSALQLDKYPELVLGLEQMAQHTRELQDSVMGIRAQPVKSVFARMPRLVRELAAELGKEIRVVMMGETTEVDKTVIEQLSDPLMHMVRNAVDHGIELPETRSDTGKSPEGTIILSAEHRNGQIVIEVADDGAGINRLRVKEKCIEKGLILPDAQPTDDEIDNFIFLPGFSTAASVSNISGRGVGMDVVKKNIQALNGRVHVTSIFGQGSRFTLSLPLTLAVLDGMVVTVGEERFIIPLSSIVESLRPNESDVSYLVGSGNVLAIRGAYIQLVSLAEIFCISGAVDHPARGLVILVEIEGGVKLGLVVDEILGQQQVVIKSLEANYQRIDGISAATILGDGRVALILDVVGLRSAAQAIPRWEALAS